MTILTGFLGAGKSTLLNKVLAHTTAGRIAVIVNEFGEVGLDHDLIEATSEEVVLLSSGCICCSIRGDLAQTIANLISRRERGDLNFERVVIETTGLADPAPIQQTLLVDHFLATHTYLDGVVTVADAVNGPGTLDTQFEAVSQAATADLILLSKTDLASPAEVKTFRSRLERLNGTAPILEVSELAKTPTHLFGSSGFRRGTTPKATLAWLSQPQSTETRSHDPFANLSGLVSTEPSKNPSSHDSRIKTASVVLEHPLKDAVFDHWLDTLVARRGQDLLRVKGIVFLEGIETPFVFHGVQHIFNAPIPLKNWPVDDATSRIVIIARDVTEAELQESLDMLRSNQEPPPQPALFAGWNDVEGKNWP